MSGLVEEMGEEELTVLGDGEEAQGVDYVGDSLEETGDRLRGGSVRGVEADDVDDNDTDNSNHDEENDSKKGNKRSQRYRGKDRAAPRQRGISAPTVFPITRAD